MLAAKFGAGAAFALLYMATLHYFPNRFLGRVFGTCNVTARFATIFAPMVAEAADPTPEVTIIVTCFLAAILAKFLRKPKENQAPTEPAHTDKGIELA